MHYPLITITGAYCLNILGFITALIRVVVLFRPREAFELFCVLVALTLVTTALLSSVITQGAMGLVQRLLGFEVEG